MLWFIFLTFVLQGLSVYLYREPEDEYMTNKQLAKLAISVFVCLFWFILFIVTLATFVSITNEVNLIERNHVMVDESPTISLIRDSQSTFTTVKAVPEGYRFALYGDDGRLLDEVVLPRSKVALTVLKGSSELSQRLELKTNLMTFRLKYKKHSVLSQWIKSINFHLTQAELNRLLDQ